MADFNASLVIPPTLLTGQASGGTVGAVLLSFSSQDMSAPVLANFSPADGTSLAKYDPITFDVTDLGEFNVSVVVGVYIVSTDTTELAHNGILWENRYFSATAGEVTSSMVAIDGGYRYTLRRRGGWPSGGIKVKVTAVDRGGNIGVL